MAHRIGWQNDAAKFSVSSVKETLQFLVILSNFRHLYSCFLSGNLATLFNRHPKPEACWNGRGHELAHCLSDLQPRISRSWALRSSHWPIPLEHLLVRGDNSWVCPVDIVPYIVYDLNQLNYVADTEGQTTTHSRNKVTATLGLVVHAAGKSYLSTPCYFLLNLRDRRCLLTIYSFASFKRVTSPLFIHLSIWPRDVFLRSLPVSIYREVG